MIKNGGIMEKKKHGFTLAELLIVVVIISVLVSISIPIFNAQVEKSRNTVDISNAKDIKNAIAYYYLQNPEAVDRLTETCNGGRHFITIQVGRPKSEGYDIGYAGGTAITNSDLQQALIDADLIEDEHLNSSQRYYGITCSSSQNWWGYVIAITNYSGLGNNENPNGNIIIKIIGVASKNTIHASHYWGDFSNDPTSFQKAFLGEG
jgi:prepilin-type N-terminal cleavage/methylation domain-containing protein